MRGFGAYANCPEPMAEEEMQGTDRHTVTSSSSDDDSDDDLASCIASRVSQARLRRTRAGASSSTYLSGGTSLNGYSRASFRREYERSNGLGSRVCNMSSKVEVVHSECNTSDNVVTIDRSLYQDLMSSKREAQEMHNLPLDMSPCEASAGNTIGTSASGCGSNSVYLNIIVEDAVASTDQSGNHNSTFEMEPTNAEIVRLQHLENENERLRTSLEMYEQKSSLLKNDKLLMSKQFQMIHNEREEINAYAKAMTAQRDGMMARIASINKDRELLRRQLSDEKITSEEVRSRLQHLVGNNNNNKQVQEQAVGSVAAPDDADENQGGAEAALATTYAPVNDLDDALREESVDDADVLQLRSILHERHERYKNMASEKASLIARLEKARVEQDALERKYEEETSKSRARLASLETECARLRDELTTVTRRAEHNESLVGEAFASVTAAIEEAKSLKDEVQVLQAAAAKPPTTSSSSSMTPTKLVSSSADPKTPPLQQTAETMTTAADDAGHGGMALHDDTPLRRRQIMLLSSSPLMSDSFHRKDFAAATTMDPYGLGEAGIEYKTSADFDEDHKRWMEVMQENFHASPGTAKLGQELLMEEHYFESMAFEKSLMQQEEEEKLRDRVAELQQQVNVLEEDRRRLIEMKQKEEEELESILMLDDDLLAIDEDADEGTPNSVHDHSAGPAAGDAVFDDVEVGGTADAASHVEVAKEAGLSFRAPSAESENVASSKTRAKRAGRKGDPGRRDPLKSIHTNSLFT